LKIFFLVLKFSALSLLKTVILAIFYGNSPIEVAGRLKLYAKLISIFNVFKYRVARIKKTESSGLPRLNG
jgi:hypothetical protein